MQIKQQLKTIFRQRFGITLDEAAFSADPALGVTGLGLRTPGFLYLLHDIETVFEIEIDPRSLEEGEFRNLQGIIRVIEGQLANECKLSVWSRKAE